MNFTDELKPTYTSSATWFKAVLPNLNYAINAEINGSGKSSGKSSGKILDLIRSNPQITIPEMAEYIGVSTRAVEKNISQLKKQGIIKRIGSHKNGSWEIQ